MLLSTGRGQPHRDMRAEMQQEESRDMDEHSRPTAASSARSVMMTSRTEMAWEGRSRRKDRSLSGLTAHVKSWSWRSKRAALCRAHDLEAGLLNDVNGRAWGVDNNGGADNHTARLHANKREKEKKKEREREREREREAWKGVDGAVYRGYASLGERHRRNER